MRHTSRIVLVTVFFGLLLVVVIFCLDAQFQEARAREYRKQHCARKLKGIGDALLAYARNNDGRFPQKLSEFYKSHLEMPSPMCPARFDLIRNIPDSEFFAAVDDPSHPTNSYIYCGAGRSTKDRKGTVIIFEKLDNHGDGINVLYNDGTVEWLSADAARAFINRQSAGTQPTTLD